LLRYFKGTSTEGIIYGLNLNESLVIINEDIINIIGYSDSDWAGDSFISYFTPGYIFMNTGNFIIWGSKKQSVVALFIWEAEYIAASYIARVAT
jgi:hypothetical protein